MSVRLSPTRKLGLINAGRQGISHEEVLADFGLKPEDFKHKD